MDKVLKILELARDKERMRKQAYEEAAEATSNALAKNTFMALAEQEALHEQYLMKYYERQVANEGWPSPGELGVNEDNLAVVREIFKRATEQIQQAGACEEGLTEVYDSAIAAEAESIEYYEDALKHASDPNARAFFQVLIDAEKMHLKLLSESQEYLDDSGRWYLDEEQWMVTG